MKTYPKQTLRTAIFLSLLLLMIVSCGQSNSQPDPKPEDKVPPTIVSLTPKDKSSSVDLLAPVTITFSEAVKKETVTNESVSLVAKDGSTIAKTLSLSADNKTLTITYQNLNTNPETVTITLAAITDLAGNALPSTSWTYTTPTWLSLSDALDVDKTHFTFEPSMATDKDGNIIIAWYEQDPVSNLNKIYVKRWNGSTWEQLGQALNTALDSSADYPSLVIDYQNRPVLAWHETDATFKSTIKCERWNGSSWETIGSASSSVMVDEGEFPSLAIAPDNTPVIAYAKNADIFVRLWNGTAWVTWDAAGALDDIATQNASRPSLVILGDTMTNLIPFVAFEEIENSSQPSSNVYVKYYDTANFAWKDIDEINDELDIDVAKDANNPTLSLALGSPLVAWEESNGIDRDIHVKVLNGSTWEDVGNDDFIAQDLSEAVLLQSYPFGESSFTYPAVVWRGSDGTGQNVYLKMFNFSTGLWETPTTPIQPINTAGIGSEHPVITIDKNYRTVVAFAEFDSVSNSQNLHVKVLNKPVLSEME